MPQQESTVEALKHDVERLPDSSHRLPGAGKRRMKTSDHVHTILSLQIESNKGSVSGLTLSNLWPGRSDLAGVSSVL